MEIGVDTLVSLALSTEPDEAQYRQICRTRLIAIRNGEFGKLLADAAGAQRVGAPEPEAGLRLVGVGVGGRQDLKSPLVSNSSSKLLFCLD